MPGWGRPVGGSRKFPACAGSSRPFRRDYPYIAIAFQELFFQFSDPGERRRGAVAREACWAAPASRQTNTRPFRELSEGPCRYSQMLLAQSSAACRLAPAEPVIVRIR